MEGGVGLVVEEEESVSQTWKKYFANRDSGSGLPLIRIRSRTAQRCGEVYRPGFVGEGSNEGGR